MVAERRMCALSRVLSAVVPALVLNSAILPAMGHCTGPLHDHQRCPICILHHATSWSLTPAVVVPPEAASTEVTSIPSVAGPKSAPAPVGVARAPPC